MSIRTDHEVVFPRTMSSSKTPSSEVRESAAAFEASEALEAPEVSEASSLDSTTSPPPDSHARNGNASSLSNRSGRSGLKRSRTRVRRSTPDRSADLLRRSRVGQPNPDLPAVSAPANRAGRRLDSGTVAPDGFDELGRDPRFERPFLDCISIAEVEMTASCGFPSPAMDYRVDELDVASYFVREPAATYIVTARGDSMVDAGILDGDKLFVDRSLEPRNGDIVLAFYDGSFTVKRLVLKNGRPELHPENSSGKYSVLRPDPETLSIEGVVVSCGRTFRR